MNPRTNYKSQAQAGNIFFAIFGAIAVVGLLGAGLTTFVRGPLNSSVSVTRQSITENQMVIAAQTALMNATSQPSQGDCDSDSFVEPVPWRDAGALPHPAGGGLIPNSIAAPKRDPWGTDYGYCVWDNGPLIADAGCGTDHRLSGHSSAGYPALAIIAAGPDRTFQTTCRNFRYPMTDIGGTADPARADTNEDGDLLDAGDFPLISKNTSASDDVIFSYTYEQAIAASGDLWTLVSAGATATLAKDLEVDGGASFTGSGDFIGIVGDAFSAVTGDVIELPPIKLPDASTYNPTCDASTIGTIRTNLGIATPPAMSSATATQGFDNADTSSVSFSGAPSAGNSIIVSVRGWTSGGFDLAANNVTDNQGNTYTLVGSGGSNGENTRVFMFAAYNIPAPTGAFTITIDPTGTGAYGAWGAMEVSGISAASLSITGGGNAAGTATATGTTATANSFAVGLIGVFGDTGELSNFVYDSAGGWAQPLVKNDIPSMSTVVKVIPAAGSTVSHTWTYGMSTVYAVREFMAVWSPAAASAGGGTAIQMVQKSPTISSSTSSSISAVLPVDATAGNTIIVPISTWNGEVTAVTDMHGRTYTKVSDSLLQNLTRTYVWVANNVDAGPVDVRVTTAYGGTSVNIGALEFSGLADSNLVDQTGAFRTFGGTTATVTTGGATDQANELVIAVHNAAYDAQLAYQVDPTYTVAFTQNDAQNYAGHSSVYKILTATETPSHTWTYTAPTNGFTDVASSMVTLRGASASGGGGGGGGGGTPMMTLMTEDSFATVDLTALNYTDWALWDDNGSLAPLVRKSGGGSLIPNAQIYGGGSASDYNNSPRTMTWTDGTPTASGSSTEGLYNFPGGVGTGLEMVFPADTTLRTAKLYIQHFDTAVIRVTTILSDGSVANQVDTSLPSSGSSNEMTDTITVNYRAGSAGQTMTVRWEVVTGAGGATPNVTLHAAALNVGGSGGGGPGGISLVGVHTNMTCSCDSDEDITVPAGVAEDDLMLIAIAHDGTSLNVTWPPGFTELERGSMSAPDGHIYAVAYKVADGTETGNLPMIVSTSPGSIASTIAVYRGVDPADPIEDSSEGHTGDLGDTNPWPFTVPSLTTTAANAKVVVFGMFDYTSDLVGAQSMNSTWPSGYTERAATNGGAGWSTINMADGDYVGPGTLSGLAGTANSSKPSVSAATGAVAVALKPLSGGGGGSCSNGGGGGGSGDAPALVAVTSGQGVGGNMTIAKPGGTSTGDLMVMAVAGDNGQNHTVQWPAGFIQLEAGEVPAATPDGQGWAMAYKLVDGTEPSSFSFTMVGASGMAAIIATYSGIDAADPIDDSAVYNSAPLGTSVPWTVTGPSLTTTNANSRLVWFAAADPNGDVLPGQPIDVTVPSGFTERADIMGGTGWVWLAMGDGSQATPGATGALSGTATSTFNVNNAFGVMAVALNAGTSGGGNPIAFVQKAAVMISTSSSPAALTLPAATFSGNTVIVPISTWSGSVSSVTDNQGNVYTRVGQSIEGVTNTYLYVANNVSNGGLTVTVSFSGEMNFGVMEFSGLAEVNLVDRTGTYAAQGGNTSTVAASGATRTAHELAIAIHGAGYNGTMGYAFDPTWTEAFTQNNAGTYSGHSSVYKILDDIETPSHTWTHQSPPDAYQDSTALMVTLRGTNGANFTCPAGYTLRGISCYKANPVGSTWAQARAACQADGGDLAVPNDRAEHAFLGTLYSSAEAWIGYSDIAAEGTWVWNTPSTYEDTVNRVCAEGAEFSTLNINAAAGQVFTGVDFASYGTPDGSCGGYTQGACHAATSSTAVSTACVGNSSCNVTADNTSFSGDPCMNVAKRLYVQLRDDSSIWAAGDPDGGASADCASIWSGGSPAHGIADVDCSYTTPQSICEVEATLSGGSGGSVISIGQIAPAVTGGDPSVTSTFAVNPTAGSSIVVPVSAYGRLFSVSDNAGNSYAVMANMLEGTGTGAATAIYVATNIKLPASGTLAVTSHYAQYAEGTMRPYEVLGLDPVNTKDQFVEYEDATGGVNTTITAPAPNSQANELAVAIHYAAYSNNPLSPYAVAGGWTAVNTNTNCQGSICQSSAYKILSATETTSHTWTHAGPVDSDTGVAATMVTLLGNDAESEPNAYVEKVSILGERGGQSNILETSFAELPAAGNTIVVFITNETNTADYGNMVDGDVTDNQGNTYVRVTDTNTLTDYSVNTYAFVAYNISAPTGTFTISADYGNPVTGRIGAVELQGIEDGGLEATGVNFSGYTASNTVTSSATTSANTLAVAAISDYVGGTHDKEDGWSYLYNEADNGIPAFSVVAKSQTVAGPIGHTWNYVEATRSSAIIMAFRTTALPSDPADPCDDDDDDGDENTLLQMCDGNGVWRSVGGGGSSGGGVVVEESSSSICNGTTVSTVRYNTSTARPEYCNGTSWRPFVLNESGVVLTTSPVYVDQLNSLANAYSDAVTITITNNGSETSGPLAFSFTGTNTGSFNHTYYGYATTCTNGITLDPGESCTKQVASRTATNGPITANFQITDGSATALVPLSGAGSQNSACEPGLVAAGGIVVSCANATTPYHVITEAGCAASTSEPACTNSPVNGANNDPDFANASLTAYTVGNGDWYTPQSPQGDIQTLTVLAYGGVRAAAAYCNNLVKGGYSDWYLPTGSEWRGLIYPLRTLLRFNLGSNEMYWTSDGGWTYGTTADNMSDFNIDTAWVDNQQGVTLRNVRCMRKVGAPAPSAIQDTDPNTFVLPVFYTTSINTTNVLGPAFYITGINTTVPVTISGPGSPQFRIHNGTSWSGFTTTGTISNMYRIQISADTPAAAGMERAITLNVGTSKATYLIRTLQTATKRIFITSTTQNGNLGGFAGADATCQTRANSVPLGGTWYALLGGGGVNGFDRIPWNWNRLDNMANSMVANNIGELRDTADNLALVNRTQANAVQNATNVWTGMTRTDWGYFEPDTGCSQDGVAGGQWRSNNGSLYGTAGFQNTLDLGWMQDYSLPACNTNRRLYCVGPF